MAFVAYLRLCQSGQQHKAFPSALADYAWRKVRSGRTLCSAKTSDALQCYRTMREVDLRQKGSEFESDCRLGGERPYVRLDKLTCDEFTVPVWISDRGTKGDSKQVVPRSDRDWKEMPISDGRFTPFEYTQPKLDTEAFFRMLPRKLRHIAECFARGESRGYIASRLGLSAGRVSQYRDMLRRKWNELQG